MATYTPITNLEDQLLKPTGAVSPLIDNPETPPAQMEPLFTLSNEPKIEETDLPIEQPVPESDFANSQEPITQENFQDLLSRLPTFEDKRSLYDKIDMAKGARKLVLATELLNKAVRAGKITIGMAETAVGNLISGWLIDPMVGVAGGLATGVETVAGTPLAADVTQRNIMQPLRQTLSELAPPYTETGKEVQAQVARGFETLAAPYKEKIVDPIAKAAGKVGGPNWEGVIGATGMTLPAFMLELLGVRQRIASKIPATKMGIKPREVTKIQKFKTKYLPTIFESSKEREAARLLNENIMLEPEAWASKFEEGVKLQNQINANLPEGAKPFKFNLSQLTEDPKTTRFASQISKRYGPAAPAIYEQLMNNNVESLKAYLNNVKPQYSPDRLRRVLEGDAAGFISDIAEYEGQMSRIVSNMRRSINLEEAGQTVRKNIALAEAATRIRASELYDMIPPDYIYADYLVRIMKREMKPSFVGESPAKTLPIEVRRGIQAIVDNDSMVMAKELFDLRSGWSSILRDMRDYTKRNRRGERRMIKGIQAIDHILQEPEFAPRTEAYFDWLEKTVKGEVYYPGMDRNTVKLARAYYNAMDNIYKGKKLGRNTAQFKNARAYFERVNSIYKNRKTVKGVPIDPFKRAKAYFSWLDKLYSGEGYVAGSSAAAYERARAYFFENVVRRYEKKDIRDINKFETQRGFVADAEVVGRFWKKGPQGIQAADIFTNAVGRRQLTNRGPWEALEAWIDNDFLNSVVDPSTTNVSKTKLDRWLSDYSRALERYGLLDRYKNVENARTTLDWAYGLKDQFDKSISGKMLGYDINTEIDALRKSKTPEQDALSLMKSMRHNSRAVKGTQKALIEQLESADITDIGEVNRLYNQMSKVYNVVFKDNPEGLKTLRNYHKAANKLFDTKTPLPDNFYAMEEFFQAIFPTDIQGMRAYRSLRWTLYGWIPQIGKEGVKRIALDILLNPETAKKFKQIADGELSPKVTQQWLKQYIIQISVPATMKMLTVPSEKREE